MLAFAFDEAEHCFDCSTETSFSLASFSFEELKSSVHMSVTQSRFLTLWSESITESLLFSFRGCLHLPSKLRSQTWFMESLAAVWSERTEKAGPEVFWTDADTRETGSLLLTPILVVKSWSIAVPDMPSLLEANIFESSPLFTVFGKSQCLRLCSLHLRMLALVDCPAKSLLFLLLLLQLPCSEMSFLFLDRSPRFIAEASLLPWDLFLV